MYCVRYCCAVDEKVIQGEIQLNGWLFRMKMCCMTHLGRKKDQSYAHRSRTSLSARLLKAEAAAILIRLDILMNWWFTTLQQIGLCDDYRSVRHHIPPDSIECCSHFMYLSSIQGVRWRIESAFPFSYFFHCLHRHCYIITTATGWKKRVVWWVQKLRRQQLYRKSCYFFSSYRTE